MNIILAAAQLARKAHEGQTRKYTGRAYIEHPARVAGRVAVHPEATETMVAAAFLHDALEDTQASEKDILEATNEKTLELVRWMTNASKARKYLKLVDRIDNLLEMSGAPWDFKVLYAQESILLVEVIGEADRVLAKDLVEIAQQRKSEAALP